VAPENKAGGIVQPKRHNPSKKIARKTDLSSVPSNDGCTYKQELEHAMTAKHEAHLD
jgi:hypothetical protein